MNDMAKIKTTKIVPEHNVERISHMKCDICGIVSFDDDRWKDKEDDTFEYKQTSIRLDISKAYPGYGHSYITEYDICPSCFRNKLIPWLGEHGAQPTIREVDF